MFLFQSKEYKRMRLLFPQMYQDFHVPISSLNNRRCDLIQENHYSAVMLDWE